MEMEARLPTHVTVGAVIRTAALQAIPILVVRKGETQSGTIVLKVNLMNGFAHVLTQMRQGEELVWSPVTATDPLPEAEADKIFMQQGQYDPDVWLIEIEDKTGNHWFSGRRI